MQFSFIDNYCYIHLHGENLIQEENMPKLPLINVPIKVTCTNSNIYMHPVWRVWRYQRGNQNP